MDEIINPIICYLSDNTNLTVPKNLLEHSAYFKGYLTRWTDKNEINIPDYIDPDDFREFIYSISFPTRISKRDVKYLFDYFAYSIDGKTNVEKNNNKNNYDTIYYEDLQKQMLINKLKKFEIKEYNYKNIRSYCYTDIILKKNVNVYYIDITDIYKIKIYNNNNNCEITFSNNERILTFCIDENTIIQPDYYSFIHLFNEYMNGQYDNIL